MADEVIVIVEPPVPNVNVVAEAPLPPVVVQTSLVALAGAPGIVKVNHGSDAAVARPDATLVYWVGTVEPINGEPDDLLMLKGP